MRGKGKNNSARPGFAAPDFPFRDVDKVFVEKSVQFMTDNKDRPFFLYLPLSAPHAPFWPADFAAGKTHSKRGDLVWQFLVFRGSANLFRRPNFPLILVQDSAQRPYS